VNTLTRDVPMLLVEGLTVEYLGISGQSRAVSDVSFSVDRREVVGIVGESGSGKSTATLAVLGLVRPPGRIVAGHVQFDGVSISGLPEREWSKVRGDRIALIPQRPRAALSPVSPIGSQICEVYRAHRPHASRREAWARGIDMLAAVGINDPERRMDAFPHELSGGTVQRVLLAMGLACEPALLIADEPTSGLDVTIQAQVLDDIHTAVTLNQSALLIVTQDLAIVANYCDRAYVMHAGEIVESAPTESLFARPASPASLALIAAQRRVAARPLQDRSFSIAHDGPESSCRLEPRCTFSDPDAGCRSVHPALVAIDDRHEVRCHRAATVQNAARAILDDPPAATYLADERDPP
jgi:ABC-type dipeptide/oligopeptide/nickel transport system ATPase component